MLELNDLEFVSGLGKKPNYVMQCSKLSFFLMYNILTLMAVYRVPFEFPSVNFFYCA